MKKVLLIVLIAVLLCSPAYAARKDYRNRETAAQKKKNSYERRREEQKLRRKARKERAAAEIASWVGKSKPIVKIQVKRKETEFYPQEKSQLECPDIADGCALYGAWIWIDIDCVKVKITVSLEETLNKVYFDKQYPKGSCDLDAILKHELTHIHLGRGTYDKVAKYAGAEAAVVVEKMQKNQNSCQEIKAALAKLSYRYNEIAGKEQDKQNTLIDGKERYAYQFAQCYPEKQVSNNVYAAPETMQKVARVSERSFERMAIADNVRGTVAQKVENRQKRIGGEIQDTQQYAQNNQYNRQEQYKKQDKPKEENRQYTGKNEETPRYEEKQYNRQRQDGDSTPNHGLNLDKFFKSLRDGFKKLWEKLLAKGSDS